MSFINWWGPTDRPITSPIIDPVHACYLSLSTINGDFQNCIKEQTLPVKFNHNLVLGYSVQLHDVL